MDPLMSLMIVGAIGLFIVFHNHQSKSLMDKVTLETFGYILFGAATTISLMYLFAPIPVMDYENLHLLRHPQRAAMSSPMGFSGCFGGDKESAGGESTEEGGILDYVI